jgi:hypothetical protein
MGWLCGRRIVGCCYLKEKALMQKLRIFSKKGLFLQTRSLAIEK